MTRSSLGQPDAFAEPPGIEQQPDLAGALLLSDTFLGPDLRLQALKSREFHLVAQNKCSKFLVDGLLIAHQLQARSTGISISSGLTGLAEEDSLEWADMDPELAQRLGTDPKH